MTSTRSRVCWATCNARARAATRKSRVKRTSETARIVQSVSTSVPMRPRWMPLLG